jgi:hypothetical protein
MTVKENLTALHKKSSRHRSSLAKSKVCGCFYCFHEFPFVQIVDWIDDKKTALCPYCGIDAVLGFNTPAADQELLHAMHERWFENPKRLTPEEWKKAAEGHVWPPVRVKPAKPK